MHGDELNSAKAVPKRMVAFQPLVRVVLIPSRREYATADLLTTLWWEDSDYSFFKTTAVSELRALMLAKGITNLKEAIKDLYQPNNSDTEIASPRSTATSSPTIVNRDVEKTSNPRRFCGSKKPSMALIEARTDVELAFWPDAAYLIVSLASDPPDLKAFTIRDGRIAKRELQVT